MVAVLSEIIEVEALLRTCVYWFVIMLNGCGQSPATIQYITASEQSALLAFVSITDGYKLVHCNSFDDLANGATNCREIVPHLTLEQLAEVKDKLEAELTTSSKYRNWLLPTLFAVASVVVSKAVVRDLMKVVPITFAVGIVLSYGQRQLLHIVQFRDEKRVIVEELQGLDSEHRSSTSLTIVEEVLLSYLRPEVS